MKRKIESIERGKWWKNKTNCGSLNNRSEHESLFSLALFPPHQKKFLRRSTKTKWSFTRMKRIDCWNRNFGVTSGNYMIIVNILNCSCRRIFNFFSFVVRRLRLSFMIVFTVVSNVSIMIKDFFLSFVEWRFAFFRHNSTWKRSQELGIPKR